MRRRAYLAVVLLPLLGCIHDWSLPLAGSDAVTTEAGADAAIPTSDGGSDAGAFCDERALICDRFDDGPLGATWDLAVSPGGRLATDPFDGAPSAPKVLTAERPADDDAASTAYVSKVVSRPLSRVRMVLALAPELLDPTEYATVAAIVFGHQGPSEHKIRLALRRDAAQVQELGATALIASHDLARSLPLRAWSRIALEVEAGGRIRVDLDGSSVLDVAADPSWSRSTRTLLVAGINFVPRPHQLVRVRIDDVRADGSD